MWRIRVQTMRSERQCRDGGIAVRGALPGGEVVGEWRADHAVCCARICTLRPAFIVRGIDRGEVHMVPVMLPRSCRSLFDILAQLTDTGKIQVAGVRGRNIDDETSK